VPGGAPAAPSVRLHATLSPEILGHSTTIGLRIEISPGSELVPPPLISGLLRYPAGLNVQLSGLGIEACSIITLELSGPQSCPPDSRMGYGGAIAEAPIKGEVFDETAKIAILRANEDAGHQALLLYVYGETGVNADIPLLADLLPDPKPFGGLLDIHVPVIETFPEGPDLSVTELRMVLGPANLVYYEHVHGRRVAYRPAGIPLPGRCPHGGFPFSVQLGFMDGSQAVGATAVPCPRTRARRRRQRR
jgi:hypothetical protein